MEDRIATEITKSEYATSSMPVELIDSMGSDLTVVNAATVSFGKKKTKLDNHNRMLNSYSQVGKKNIKIKLPLPSKEKSMIKNKHEYMISIKIRIEIRITLTIT